MKIDVYKMLRYDEGERLTSYLCSQGFLTVGIGHNLIADPAIDILGRKITKVGEHISQVESNKLFNQDKSGVYHDLDKHIPDWGSFKDKYQYILVNMCFNMGIAGLVRWKNTINAMRKDIQSSVIAGIRASRYAQQVPKRAERMCKLAQDIIPNEYI